MSYLRLVTFTFSESGRSHAQPMADDLIPAIKSQPGCITAVYFGSEDGASGLAVVWDSQAHADAAATVIRPRLEQHLQGNLTAPPEAALHPILAS